ncbi:LolA family protein [Tenacibaculum piscium]|uniref:LolA family protein n=1 Tax=Tenacibaculum piscium TaxID=1458515 RepID=UPI001F2013BF|nr:outer membrane lipoprotein carrier protein LolA [Tenacibaculum piscium]MCG8182442.1 outer membrane lipoprotein carrier protein LolA [Tenacibaculum piscium]MCG8203834.1 outer membrane lipoprotein carrier protein LolA [Tenacibaculum piscium]
MRKLALIGIALFISFNTIGQNTSSQAKELLDQVANKMGAYSNMFIDFNSSLINKEAGIINDTPIRGEIKLAGEKYNLNYLGNNFIFDGNKLVVINQDEKEITISDSDLDEDDGFIYPSKLLTFYKKGYTFSMGKLKNNNGRKVQFVDLFPIDSNSDIVKVMLGIDAKTKHIYKLIQIGSNGAETTFTIVKFKSNQPISSNLFSFDKQKYLKQGYFID